MCLGFVIIYFVETLILNAIHVFEKICSLLHGVTFGPALSLHCDLLIGHHTTQIDPLRSDQKLEDREIRPRKPISLTDSKEKNGGRDPPPP